MKLPDLPYGEGSMHIRANGKIEYRKTINNKRLSVYGNTPKECMRKMKEKENKENESLISGNKSLQDMMMDWYTTFKKAGVSIKESSYDRGYRTMFNQIFKYPIAKIQVQAIDEKNIQNLINTLIDKEYSYSTVKKTYELLSQFFKYFYTKSPYNNPMLLVSKPTKSAMKVEEKEIDFFDEDDIKLIINECKKRDKDGNYKYRMGYGIILLMFTGMRINEALYLHWNEWNKEKNTLSIIGSRARVIDYSKPKKSNGSFNYKTINSKSTKTKKGIREIPLTENAIESLQELYKIQEGHNSLEDFIFATKTGNQSNEQSVRKTLNRIQKNANTKVQKSGLHILRHTFCSLLCREGIDEGVVANILGQENREMVKRVYRHISNNERINAVCKIKKY